MDNCHNKGSVIIILGPTAVGKTELSLKLAQKLQTEIISGDSMLVYKGFDIGTAKPNSSELASVKHHMIDILNPHDSFNVTMFCSNAARLIKQINADNKIPIIAGGTGLYIKSLIEGYQFNAAPDDPAYRAYLEDLAQRHGREYVLGMLAEVDPKAAERLHVNNFRRIIRALEVYKYNKDTISQTKISNGNELLYNAVVIGLNRDRADLYQRIDKRVEQMISAGWLQEVENLLHSGVERSMQPMQAIGYKLLAAHLNGEISLEYAVEQIKTSTRHFAKRQLTWYRKMPYIQWFQVDKLSPDELLAAVYDRILAFANYSIYQ